MYKQTNKRNVLLFYSFTPPSYKCCRDNYYNYWSNRIDLVITPHSIAHIWTSAINELLKLSEHANQWADLCPLLIDRLDFGKRLFSSDVLRNEIYLNSTHINQTQNYGLETKMWYVFNAWPAHRTTSVIQSKEKEKAEKISFRCDWNDRWSCFILLDFIYSWLERNKGMQFFLFTLFLCLFLFGPFVLASFQHWTHKRFVCE